MKVQIRQAHGVSRLGPEGPEVRPAQPSALWSPGSAPPRFWRSWPGAQCARKITALEEAFTGYFTGHHAFLPRQMPGRVDAITAGIAALDARIEAEITPFAAAVHKIDEVPGISLAAAHAILAETGLG
jgi:transposase